MLYTDARLTTRERTPEGLLRAHAILTRTGEFDYLASELNGLGIDEGMYKVMRTRDTVAHADTLASVRGIPITINHPPDGEVNANNYRMLTVGNVAGEPSVDEEGFLHADILLADREAIRLVNSGVDQLSIGYDVNLYRREDGDILTTGPLRINHVAIVDAGRAGEKVRVLDSQEKKMDEDKIKLMLDAAISKALTDAKPKSSQDDIAALISAAVEPVMAEVKTLQDMSRKKKDEEDMKMKKDEAQKAADELVNQIRSEERTRFAVLQDAIPLISGVDSTALAEMSVKDILVLALKDAIPEAASHDEAFLRGALAIAKRNMDSQKLASKDGKPTGIGQPAPQAPIRGADQQTTESYQKYVDSLTSAWMGKQTGSDK